MDVANSAGSEDIVDIPLLNPFGDGMEQDEISGTLYWYNSSSPRCRGRRNRTRLRSGLRLCLCWCIQLK